MSSKLRKLLKEQLMCPICHEQLEDAKVLKCGHTFCKKCLHTLILSNRPPPNPQNYNRPRLNTLRCPYCCQNVPIDAHVANGLPSNFIVNNISQALTTNDASSNLSPMMCTTHPDNELKYYCEECKVIACSDCTILNHFKHGDRIMPLHDIATKIKSSLLDIDSWCIVNEHLINRLKDVRTQGCQALRMVLKDLEKEYQVRCKALADEKLMLSEMIKSKKNIFLKNVHYVLKGEEALKRKMVQLKQAGASKLAENNILDIVHFFPDWKTELGKQLSRDFTSIEYNEQELHLLTTLHFERVATPSDDIPGLGCFRRLGEEIVLPHHSSMKRESNLTKPSRQTVSTPSHSQKRYNPYHRPVS